MKGIDFSLLFDIFLILFGIYLLYASWKMKKTGDPGTMLLEAEEMRRCNSKKKMAEEVAGKLLPFGGVTVLCGIAGTVNMLCVKNRLLNTAILFVFLVLCLWFVSKFRHMREKFLRETGGKQEKNIIK